MPDRTCGEAFGRLLLRIDALKGSASPEDVALCRELEAGKMVGVMVAKDVDGRSHELYAFSGQIGGYGFCHPDFVEPVFDYLQPDGYFKNKEREISLQNESIRIFEQEEVRPAEQRYECEKERLDRIIDDAKERIRQSKLRRDEQRVHGVTAEEEAVLVKESQFEKAELKRLKKRIAEELTPYRHFLEEAQTKFKAMKAKRHADSEALQKWLFDNFRLSNAFGEEKSLGDIFGATPFKAPPSGAGECCAPKLLQAAYRRGWKPISMAEYWYGRSPVGEIRRHGNYYPACRGKCLPVLRWMLQGLDIEPPLDSDEYDGMLALPEILYENEWFCVVSKPAGMLSVPGKGNALSVEQWLKHKYGINRPVRMAHRLDQDTSGLLIGAFGDEAYKVLQSLFSMRKVRKTYIADLKGDFKALDIPSKGRIVLPLSPDWLDRPRQRVDYESGKESITEYEFLKVENGHSRVAFNPLTGRTHQLRVHAASTQGLGMPIVGDRLYGDRSRNPLARLHLHAHKIEFDFPIDGKKYSFESPVPF